MDYGAELGKWFKQGQIIESNYRKEQEKMDNKAKAFKEKIKQSGIGLIGMINLFEEWNRLSPRDQQELKEQYYNREF